MKKISDEEYKKVLLDILKYIDNVCRKNNIKYSLIGGSLIGAIREKRILEWDDDVDIVIDSKDLIKLGKLINEKNDNYFFLYNEFDNNYPFTYAKVIDKRTLVKEPNGIDLDEYGAFVDVFANHNAPNNIFLRKLQHKIAYFKQSMINGYLHSEQFRQKEKGLKRIRTSIAKKISINKLLKSYNATITKYDKCQTDYKIRDFVKKNFQKSVLSSDLFDEYVDVKFEDMKAMSIKDYDKYLTMMFGDYMTPPNKKEQICHNIEAYWKEEK